MITLFQKVLLIPLYSHIILISKSGGIVYAFTLRDRQKLCGSQYT